MNAVLAVVGRSEAEVAADAVWALFEAGLIPKTARNVQQACLAARLPVDALRQAEARYRRSDAPRPRTDAVVPGTTPFPVSQRHAEANRHTVRYLNAHPEPGKRRCARCKEVKPEDVEHFPWKNKARRIFHSYCRPCHTDQQRERRLTVTKVRALNAVGLTFEFSEVDPRGSLCCMDCGCPIRPGEVVHGQTTLRHVVCPTDR